MPAIAFPVVLGGGVACVLRRVVPIRRMSNAENAALPEASLMNFLSGLASQALMQFGEIPNPHTGEREANPAFAKYTVEILRILSEKTAGNLTEEEDSYLKAILTDFDKRIADSGLD